jgi:NAD(P)H dehydrogenase (quinone)
MYQQANVVVIWHGATARVRHLARAVRDGARERGAEVRVRWVPRAGRAPVAGAPWPACRLALRADAEDLVEATPDDLVWADAVLFGTPVRHAVVAPELKRLIDAAGPLWRAGRLAGKVYGVFAPATPSPREPGTRLLALTDVFRAWRGLVVPARCVGVFERGAGAGRWSAPAGPSEPPSHAELAAARCHGRRATEAALALGAERRVLCEVA